MKDYQKARVRADIIANICEYIDEEIEKLDANLRRYESAIADPSELDAETIKEYCTYIGNIREAISVYQQSMAKILSE